MPVAAPTAAEHAPVLDAPARPRLGAVLKHLALAILTANVIPGVLFYVCMVIANIWLALSVALAWCYGAAAWRIATKRKSSVLLFLSIIGLTGKTIFAFATGSTYVYFLQPLLTDVAFTLLFLGSLLTAQPVVGRLARDFYPVDDELARRPRVQTLFWRLTLLWAVVAGIRASVSLYLLNTESTAEYVAIKSVLNPCMLLAGTTLTVMLSVKVARHEGLMGALATA